MIYYVLHIIAYKVYSITNSHVGIIHFDESTPYMNTKRNPNFFKVEAQTFDELFSLADKDPYDTKYSH